MKIERVDLMIVQLPLVRAFTTSASSKSMLNHILVKVYAEGEVGWGECACPSEPYYCEETTETCWHLLKDFLVPAILGQTWQNVEEFTQFYRRVKRNHFAKAGLEMACWELLARAQGKPLYQLLGGTRQEILSGVSLGIEAEIEQLFERIDQYLAEGYRRIKLKIAPGKDVATVRQVRQRFPDMPLMVDANSAYTLADLPLLKQLDEFHLMMIEQPLAHDDLFDHAQLQRELVTPICLDESILSVDDARKALALGSCRIINIKVGRVGGLLAAKRIHDYCFARGVPVWCGGMHEYGIGRAANLALASLPGFSIPGDISGADKYYKEDLVMPPILAVSGAIPVPQQPGLGVAPNNERIAQHTVRTLTLTRTNRR